MSEPRGKFRWLVTLVIAAVLALLVVAMADTIVASYEHSCDIIISHCCFVFVNMIIATINVLRSLPCLIEYL